MTNAPTPREALEKCRETFAAYAEMHRQKLPAPSLAETKAILAKVDRNKEMADLCIAALSAQVPEDDARLVEVLRTRLNRLRDSQDLPVGDGAGARVAVNLHALADVLISAHEAADRIEALGSPVRS